MAKTIGISGGRERIDARIELKKPDLKRKEIRALHSLFLKLGLDYPTSPQVLVLARKDKIIGFLKIPDFFKIEFTDFVRIRAHQLLVDELARRMKEVSATKVLSMPPEFMDKAIREPEKVSTLPLFRLLVIQDFVQDPSRELPKIKTVRIEDLAKRALVKKGKQQLEEL